ncbi:MAG: DNA recombination protein RmuC [Pseudomonadota bacterium]|nr:DNA recombination protein RmuC [Pseudomonadota bacterium]
MEITWVLAVIATVGAILAAYFAKLWLKAKAELAEVIARSETNTNLEQKTILMKAEFEALSQKLLNERSKELTSQHSDSLTQLLKPLTTELDAFKKRVNEVYENETRDRVSLRQEILSLKALNQKMSEDAINLTRALKGENKTAGNWGELVLDQVLSASGLREGYEYSRQQSFTADEGSRLQPDVVISLPDEKCLIVDAKLSLKDYERATSAVDDAERLDALKAHTNSLKTHVRGLSGKNYSGLPGITTVDFVIMFVPVEPAFSAAFETQPQLFTDALGQGVVIASPSTLLALLRTVEHVWRIEHQNRNTRQIADLGGKLYDQFVLFAESFQDVGDRIRRSQEAFDKAGQRLSLGRGNLVRRAEQLKALGVSSTKQMPAELQDLDD